MKKKRDGLVLIARREYVPHDDQTGPCPPEHSYELFATGRPTTEPGTTRRFYLARISHTNNKKDSYM